ncbi:MAG: hypothetical protein WC285_06635 [Candidatus Gracilibacteria bacterium]|jgi:hypothetical protein
MGRKKLDEPREGDSPEAPSPLWAGITAISLAVGFATMIAMKERIDAFTREIQERVRDCIALMASEEDVSSRELLVAGGFPEECLPTQIHDLPPKPFYPGTYDPVQAFSSPLAVADFEEEAIFDDPTIIDDITNDFQGFLLGNLAIENELVVAGVGNSFGSPTDRSFNIDKYFPPDMGADRKAQIFETLKPKIIVRLQARGWDFDGMRDPNRLGALFDLFVLNPVSPLSPFSGD